MNFAIAGDIALHGLISSDPDNNSRRFSWLGSELDRFSGLIANLETPVVSEERNASKNAHLFADPLVTRGILKKLNIVCVSLANNHILDCGREGLLNTIRLLDEEGIRHSGAGFTMEQAGPVTFQAGGVRIAFVAYVHPSTHPASEAYSDIVLNIFDPSKAAVDIRSLKALADIVIVSIHWGTDYSFFHEKWQSIAARELIDAGAALIMGHHSHTLQGFESYSPGKIFYGLGSLTFGDFRRYGRSYALFRKTKNSAVFVLDENCDIKEAIPTNELKGNYIVRGKCDVRRRNRRLMALNRLRHQNKFAGSVIRFYEKVLYRIYEYFFGYYMNPLKRLIQVGNIRKITRLFR